MIRPEIIKKIDDHRREKTRPTEHRLPVHREAPPQPRSRQEVPKKQEDPSKTPVVEISVV